MPNTTQAIPPKHTTTIPAFDKDLTVTDKYISDEPTKNNIIGIKYLLIIFFCYLPT